MGFFWHVLFLIANWYPSMLAYNLVFGKGKILHFGPVGMILIIMYPMTITLVATQSFLLAALVGLLCSVIAGFIFAWLSFRLPADSFGIMSLAVHLSLLAVALNWQSVTRGALGIPGVPRMELLDKPSHMALAQLAVGVIWIVALLWIDRSAFGRKIQALAEHEWYAKSLGVNRIFVHTVAFLIHGLGSVTVVFFWIQFLGIVHPNDSLFPVLVFYVMVVVAGGPGNVLGVTLSTTLLVALKEALRLVPLDPGVLGPVRLLLFGVILFVAVWWRRDTLFPKQRSV